MNPKGCPSMNATGGFAPEQNPPNLKISLVRTGCGGCRQKRLWFMQHFLKPFSRTAGTGIIASQFFEQFFVAIHNS
jgi:hypothetical protein